ncbi:MAG TPA: response regulator transcription factor [Sphingomonas sp.]|nr:response regulator transcription factor [Sphingomonas sp.]
MRVLVAEDDRETAEFVRRGLGELGHAVLTAADGVDALHHATTEDWDVIVLDRMLPGLDGASIVRRLRAAQIATPVLMLTALGRIQDRVEGLDAGADDYLVKPFAFSELHARLNALTRRMKGQEVATSLVCGALAVDLLKRQVTFHGRPVITQPREFRLLEELMRNADRVVTRTMLLERVWDLHFDPQTNIVETHISRLRAKLAEAGARDVIETVRGVGYRMRGAD